MAERRLAELPSRTLVFVDASVMIPAIAGQGAIGHECANCLRRAARGEILAFTSATAVSETVHRVIVTEAISRFNLTPREAVDYLKKHPDRVKTLHSHLSTVDEIENFGITVLPVTYQHLQISKAYRQSYGLMTNDSLMLAVMQARRLKHLATNDRDFNRVANIRVWSP